MKKPFEVGERVAVYADARREVGVVASVKDVFLTINLAFGGSPFLVHQKQCRRLIPKKRREIYISIQQCGDVYCNYASIANEMKPGETIKFRECK